MIVYTRREDQTIRIGEAIVRVREIHKSRVVISIDAPRDVVVRRGEQEQQTPAEAVREQTKELFR